ncbi:MAG: amino acid permease [Planctomycetes bacterium]|nr:amino acid permease [Planctomycetota bacterium]MCB9918881.1 amino acid permease [Planctomycetota bacterium]
MSVSTVALLIVLTVFGFANATDNLAAIGLAAIPSWIVVGVLYFLPLSLMLAEFSSALPDKRGGIYSYMELGLGPTWAFVGTWAYFVSNLVYLQSVLSRLVINISLASTGRDVFAGTTWAVPLLAVVLCVLLTWISTRGVRTFGRFVKTAGRVVLVCTFTLIAVSILAVAFGLHASASPYSVDALVPSFDLGYAATFAWLLFAVAGAESAGPYVHETENPKRDFPRAILSATLIVTVLYVLGSVAASFLLPVGSIDKSTAVFDCWKAAASIVGLPGDMAARVVYTVIALVSVIAYVVWMESPIRAMFADVPEGTFPRFLTKHDAEGTHHNALWTQAAVLTVLILVPLVSILTGLSGSDRLVSLLNDLTSLAVVVPYFFVAIAYVRARRAGMVAPFQMVRSTRLAIAIGWLTVAVSALGYCGAGLFALQSDPIDWIYVATVYLGPGLLIVGGLLLRSMSLAAHRARLETHD